MDDFEWELLDRYLAGEATPAEREQFEAKMGSRREHAMLLAAWRRALAVADQELLPEEQRAMWDGLVARMGADAPPSLAPPSLAPPSVAGPSAGRSPVTLQLAGPEGSRWRRVGRLAAAAAVITAVGVGVWSLATRPSSEAPAARERIVTAPRGERVEVQLRDGTRVLLGAGSTLRHAGTFGTGAREVALDGEAYFAVTHDERRPFLVRAGDLIATDLGTEFLVRAYPEDTRAQVVVRSGSVAVRSAYAQDTTKGSRVVRPGELGKLGADGKPTVVRADTAVSFAWTRGTLVFDGTPLREALPQLSRWYDLDFQLADPALGSIPLSGSLDQTLTPDRLDLLAASLGLRQIRNGRVVTFERVGASRH